MLLCLPDTTTFCFSVSILSTLLLQSAFFLLFSLICFISPDLFFSNLPLCIFLIQYCFLLLLPCWFLLPQSIPNTDLKNKVCQALSLTGTTVTPDNLQACHCMKNKEKVIVKFKDRKQINKVIFSRKELKSKQKQLQNLQFGPSLFINDSMYFENQSLFHKRRQLKNAGKLFSFRFFNNTLNVKLTENGPITKIFHINDLENLLQIDSIEELLNNSSS